jgi:hypothetical protein
LSRTALKTTNLHDADLPFAQMVSSNSPSASIGAQPSNEYAFTDDGESLGLTARLRNVSSHTALTDACVSTPKLTVEPSRLNSILGSRSALDPTEKTL